MVIIMLAEVVARVAMVAPAVAAMVVELHPPVMVNQEQRIQAAVAAAAGHRAVQWVEVGDRAWSLSDIQLLMPKPLPQLDHLHIL